MLLCADFEGRRALVERVESVPVENYCGCGCATVGLSADPAAPSADKTSQPVPNGATLVDANEESIGGVVAFTDAGYLSLLEVFWYDEPISPFPPLDRLRVFGEDP
jgi:hypothetical protein